MPRFGAAHTAGLSTADFEALAGGRVAARLTFATSEPFGRLRLDRDGDGVVSPGDVAAARGELERFLLDGVDVSADGAPCTATFEGAAIDDVDGLVLSATYQCAADAEELSATLYYLSALRPGHREVARITAGEATAQGVLSGDSRAITLRLPARPPAGAA